MFRGSSLLLRKAAVGSFSVAVSVGGDCAGRLPGSAISTQAMPAMMIPRSFAVFSLRSSSPLASKRYYAARHDNRPDRERTMSFSRKVSRPTLALALLVASQVYAQGNLEEVVIAALKREESLQEAPATVTV